MAEINYPTFEDLSGLVQASANDAKIELDRSAAKVDEQLKETPAEAAKDAIVLASQADAQAFEMEAALIWQKVEQLTITDQESHDVGNESYILAKALLKKIEDVRISRTAPLLEKKRLIDQAFTSLKTRISSWADVLEDKVLAYREKVRLEAEAKERERLAEIKRLEEERRKQRDADELKARLEKERAQQDAAEAGDRLMKDLGIQIEVPPVMPAAPVVPAPAPPPIAAPPPVEMPATTHRTASGSSTEREVWTYEIIDRSAVPAEYWEINEAKISKVVKAGLREMPGVRIYAKKGLASSTKGR